VYDSHITRQTFSSTYLTDFGNGESKCLTQGKNPLFKKFLHKIRASKGQRRAQFNVTPEEQKSNV